MFLKSKRFYKIFSQALNLTNVRGLDLIPIVVRNRHWEGGWGGCESIQTFNLYSSVANLTNFYTCFLSINVRIKETQYNDKNWHRKEYINATCILYVETLGERIKTMVWVIYPLAFYNRYKVSWLKTRTILSDKTFN